MEDASVSLGFIEFMENVSNVQKIVSMTNNKDSVSAK